MEFVPTGSALVVKLAVPPLRLTAPRTVDPFLKVTAPVGVPEMAGVTVALNVTLCACFEGLSDETSVVLVVTPWTTSESAGEVLALKSDDTA
jgi:hypothetical protein